MDWNDLRYFTAIRRSGSLTGAARLLGVSVQTAGRRIAALELALGTQLFVRTSTGYLPTPDCEALIGEAERVEEAVASFKASASGRGGAIKGVVRLAAPETIASHLILPALRPFLTQHPGLELEMVTGITPVGIARGEADLALRLVTPEHGALTIRRVGTMAHGVYAARDDVTEFATARLVGWTAEHNLPASRWLHRLTGRAPELRLNSMPGQVAAITAGLGIGILPCFLAKGLKRLPVSLTMEEPLWLVAHATTEMPARVRLVNDAIGTILANSADRLAGNVAT
ncbi:LysR family transcriptional regulator [Sphingorhabdus soli]|uniref:LysR family transcriptional regulator n=2 Tax=Flavisphingopyxis soli TaxID=2601267 RepID=A0A5C6UPK4_9SPHN|nr:LysR family transcriptional regulator [Sphingorhabdus soli]